MPDSNNGTDNVYYGTPGPDIINGGNGNDDIYGGDGDDVLNGWAYYDRLDGGDGNDTLSSGDLSRTGMPALRCRIISRLSIIRRQGSRR